MGHSCGTLREVYARFPSSREAGLSDPAVTESLKDFGPNTLTPLPREPIWKKFLGKFDEPIIIILLAATLLKTVVDLFEANATAGGVGLGLIAGGYALFKLMKLDEWVPALLFGLAMVLVGVSVALGHPSYEGLAVMVAVVLATGVAFFSEYKSDREFEVLNARKESLRTKVTRGGAVVTVGMDEVAVGDLVVLEMGDEIPADGRLVRAAELYIDQSLMTGEAEPVKKQVARDDDAADGPEHPACVYRGTQVVDGAGQMVVAEVGDATMIGQIARRLGDIDEERADAGPETGEQRVAKKLTISKEQTPLQVKLTSLADTISKVGYIAAIAIFFALLVRGIAVGEVSIESDKIRPTISNLLSYFVYMVIIIVVAVPEGLPMSVTVSLALAMRKMTRANSLVRQLVACETIGSATVICSDKTGTLTQNRMQVDRLGADGRAFERGGDWPKPTTHLQTPTDWIAFNGTVNSTANLEQKEGKTVTVGNSTEGALLQWAREAGVEYGERRSRFEVLYQMHFSSDRKRMTSVAADDGRFVVLVKGVPEIVLERCTSVMDASGNRRTLTDADRKTIAEQLKDAAGQAMRTLAFAHKELGPDTPRDDESLHARRDDLEVGLTFVGFVAIRDPLRPEVKDAVRHCREAGIEVKMITGDNIETARAIGREIGLLDEPGSLALTSEEFNALTDEQLKEKLPHLRILARRGRSINIARCACCKTRGTSSPSPATARTTLRP